MSDPNTDDLAIYVRRKSVSGQSPFDVIDEAGITRAAETFGLTPKQILEKCLERGVWPERLASSRGTLNTDDQLRLLDSKVAVIGMGGLGGAVVLLLARLGLGALTLCDGDVFEDSNLNRQLLCRPDTLGQKKAEVAAREIAAISHAIDLEVVTVRAETDNLPHILAGANVAVDCLDNMPSRYALQKAASRAGIPFVHAAVAGIEGIVMTVMPGEPGLEGLYGLEPAAKQDSAEVFLGIPTMTPAMVATLEVNEVFKLLLGRRGLGPGQVLHLDLSLPSLEIMSLG